MDDNDRGHRHGNFPNYYAFHPPDVRMRVLERCNILEYVRIGISRTTMMTSSSYARSSSSDDDGVEYDDGGDVDDYDDDDDDDDARGVIAPTGKRTLRHRRRSSHGRRRRRRHDDDDGVVYVCDLGCNAGDMTMAMAHSLIAAGGTRGKRREGGGRGEVEEEEDEGRGEGGEEEEEGEGRADGTGCDIRDVVDANGDAYVDFCGGGDVAIDASTFAIHDDAGGTCRSSTSSDRRIPSDAYDHRDHRRATTTDDDGGSFAVMCLGLDIDPTLIERATSKFSPSAASVHAPPPPPPPTIAATSHPLTVATATAPDLSRRVGRGSALATFRVCDLSSETEHNDACSCFFDGGGCGDDDGDGAGGIPRRDDECDCDNDDDDDGGRSGSTVATTANATIPSSMPRPLFHLTTIFSATMWIHVHAGDDGLREFLKRACGWTRMYLLIEPQPSGW
jgi:hypothetical protein